MSLRLASERKGFTLTELLATTAILALVLAVTLPLLRNQRGKSRRTRCLNQIKWLSLACLNYESTNSRYPSVISRNEESFLVRVLPMLEQKPAYDQFRAAYDKSGALDKLASMDLEVFRCHQASEKDFYSDVVGSFTSHYAGCAGFVTAISVTSPEPLVYTAGPGDLGLNGVFSPKLNSDGTLDIGTKNGVQAAEVLDGISNTLAILETSRGDISTGKKTFTNARARWSWGLDPANQNQVNWGRSVDRKINSFDDTNGVANPYHGIAVSSEHEGGANVGKCDGSVHYVSEEIDLAVLKAAAGIDDGIEADLYK